MNAVHIVQRAAGATWRLLPTGVLVRRPGRASEAVLLTGATAVVWCALDRPRSESALQTAHPGNDEGLRLLLDDGLVQRTGQIWEASNSRKP